MLHLSKVLMQDFHYYYLNNRYGDEAEMLKLKLKMFMKIKIKIYLILVIIRKDSRFYNNSNNLVVSKTKDETGGVPIKGFVQLKSEVYTFITVQS